MSHLKKKGNVWSGIASIERWKRVRQRPCLLRKETLNQKSFENKTNCNQPLALQRRINVVGWRIVYLATTWGHMMIPNMHWA